MFTGGALSILSVAIYAGLVVALAYGRPKPPRRTAASEPRREPFRHARLAEGIWLAAIGIAVLYPLLGLIDPAIVPGLPWTVSFFGSEAVQIVGVALALTAAALLGTAFRALGSFATVDIAVRPDHEVVRAGPYRAIRHPMYTANILLTAGIALAFLATILIVPFVVVLLLAEIRARAEERLFLADPRLGAEYAAYERRTGRFLPRRPRAPSP